MVTGNSVNNHWMFFIFTGELSTNLYVTTFNFFVNSFPHIMEETSTTSKGNIFTQFARHNPSQFTNFNRVTKNILTIWCTELQTSHNLDQVRMKIHGTNFISRFFTIFTNTIIHFLAILLNQLLNTSWMNTTVFNQSFKSHACNLTTNWIKARKNNYFWRVINNDINTS